ncbi:juxtaposed with another zinc finger protein 1 isoform X1 [Tenebrio molitor]|uniref:juxtaposed with another zinc finger protein 1 isoform X1 n=1 Tax=Tenebrio molitor TaxID=7067 RepID=UPI003624A5D0
MAVFLKNTCQFNNCRKNFYTLRDLIIHIESDHLDFDPHKIEQLEEDKPDSVPMSYVLKFSGPEDSPPQYSCKTEVSYLNEAVIEELEDVVPAEVVTAFNNNYLGCDFKEKKKTEPRLHREEVSQIFGQAFQYDQVANLVLSGCRSNKLFTLDHSQKKPFACNMKGCEKRYKNVNGIKYHYKNHHKMLIPTFKKSLLRQKPMLHSKSKMERRDVHGIPLYSFKPPIPTDIVYHNVHSLHQLEECGALPNDYFYKLNSLPTSDLHVSNQVPLPNNMSFNYYNIAELNGDIEDFSGKNSNYFITNFDKL